METKQLLGIGLLGVAGYVAIKGWPFAPPCTEGLHKCEGYDLYVCEGGEWKLAEQNSSYCGYPNGNGTWPDIRSWWLHHHPNSRELTIQEAAILEIRYGWVDLAMAGGKPVSAWVCLEKLDDPVNPEHKEFSLPTSLSGYTQAIGPYCGAQAWDEMPTGYHPTYRPHYWQDWTIEDKLTFIGLCDAVTYITPPSPPNELEWSYRRAWYYERVDYKIKAPVYLFLHENWNGYWIFVNFDMPEMPEFQIPGGKVDFNDEISSIAVKSPDGYRYLATLWEHQNYKGKSFITMTDIEDFSDFGWNDMISSMQIQRLGD